MTKQIQLADIPAEPKLLNTVSPDHSSLHVNKCGLQDYSGQGYCLFDTDRERVPIFYL